MKTPNFPAKKAPKFRWGGISSVSDYSAFGVQLENRVFEGQGFRYGFQSQERDDEVKGDGNYVNFEYRMHDPRLGRFFVLDPLSAKYPYYSPYAFSGNRVIDAIEFEGLEPVKTVDGVEVLVIVVFGLTSEPAKGKTLSSNDPDNAPDKDFSSYTTEQGLSSIEEYFKDNSKVQVVSYSSSDLEEKTVADIGKTMKMFIDANPNGKIILVGHSLGADNIINASIENPDITIQLVYTIDICDEWDDDNIPENVKYAINVYQSGLLGLEFGGEDIEIDNPDKTKGYNHEAQEKNVTHTNIENMYSKRVIERIKKIIAGKNPLD